MPRREHKGQQKADRLAASLATAMRRGGALASTMGDGHCGMHSLWPLGKAALGSFTISVV
jgi:hypothetical protein